jgi:hypothetical protein
MSQPPVERERDRRSLRDLAKLANSPSLTPTPPPSKAGPSSVSQLAGAGALSKSGSLASLSAFSKPPESGVGRSSEAGDSGIVDLKMMAQVDPQASERAKDTKLASAELFDDDAPPSERPAPAPSSAPSAKVSAAAASAGRISSAPASGKPTPARAVPASAAPAGSKENEKKSGMLWLGLVGVVAAAAAAVFMFRSEPNAPAPSAAAPNPPAVTAAAPKPTPPPPAAVAAADTATAAPSNPTDPGIDPSSLPSAGTKHATAGGPRPVVEPSAEKSVTVSGKPPPNPALVAKNIPSNPSQAGSFDNALRQAAGPTETPGEGAATPASSPQFDPGSVPQKPSTGAIAGGIGSVMSGARACLGLDDPISYAAITFESSGGVSNVAVSGFAAGKPAEACIKAALGKAKVPAFAQPSYTQKVTVRPNS